MGHLAPLLSTNALSVYLRVYIVVEKMGTAQYGQIVLTGAIDKIWPGNQNPWSWPQAGMRARNCFGFIPDQPSL